MERDNNKSYGLDDQNSIINEGNQGSLQDGPNKNPILNDLNSIINQDKQGSIPKKDDDDDDDKEIEKEVDTPSQPAEEHLITEADDLHNNDLGKNSDYEDPDQGPEEIDPVNHPRDFENIPENESKRPLID